MSEIVLSGPLLLAGVIALAAGVVSFVSPCCLPLVPGYVSYVSGVAGSGSVTEERSRAGLRRRATLGTILFVLGFAAVFTSYGALFGLAGAWLIGNQDVLVRGLGFITILLGLVFLGALGRITVLNRTIRPSYRPRVGLAGAPVLGIAFGLGWTPCIGPTLAAVLTLSTSSAGAGRGAFLAFVYSLGLGLPFIAAALSVDKVMVSFAWARRRARMWTRLGGGMLVVLGVLQVSGWWGELMARSQGWIAGWQPPL